MSDARHVPVTESERVNDCHEKLGIRIANYHQSIEIQTCHNSKAAHLACIDGERKYVFCFFRKQ